MDRHQSNRKNAAYWANAMMNLGFVILDLETTGLGDDAEIVQIGILPSDEQYSFNSLIKPTVKIEEGASRVHGITAETVKEAPSFKSIASYIHTALCGRRVVIYNVAFDRPVLLRCFDAAGVSQPLVQSWECAMTQYARFHGQWNDYFESYTWQKLTKANEQMGLPVIDAHDALADCRMTLSLIKAMAKEAGE